MSRPRFLLPVLLLLGAGLAPVACDAEATGSTRDDTSEADVPDATSVGKDVPSSVDVVEPDAAPDPGGPDATVPPDDTMVDAGLPDPDPPDPGQPDVDAPVELEKFSFFVTSMVSLLQLSNDPAGFGGDLRFGETGPGAGLRGADKICATIAEMSQPGSAAKGWRAFLSATDDGSGQQVDAIDRIGPGPWYDRLGRLFANDPSELLFDRPKNADPIIRNDFPNEWGVPNHQPDPTKPKVDNHDMLTGSNDQGRLYGQTATCLDWTAKAGNTTTEGKPRVGHSWPSGGGGMGGGGTLAAPPGPGSQDMANWMSALTEAGCKPGINLVDNGAGDQSAKTVGAGGGYGGFYCFALSP